MERPLIDDAAYMTRIKRILGLTDNSKDDLISDFIFMYADAICTKCGTDAVPTTLWFILVEAVIARYNKLGSEGLKREDIDVVSVTFHDEILDTYNSYFDEYKKQNQSHTSTLPRVRFI